MQPRMNGGEKWTNGKFRKWKMENLHFLMIFCFHWYLENRKPKLWQGVSNLKIFHMININKMRAIFQFFHNGWCWYSISVDTQKTRDPNFGGSVIWNFFAPLTLTKWEPFFIFFIMANSDILFPLTLGKLETQTLGGLVIWNFSVPLILMKWEPFFNFFIMTNTDILFPLTLGKPETWIFHQFSFLNFSVGSIFSVTHLRFCLNIHAWLRINHLCADIYAWWPFCTWKSVDMNFPSIQFSKLFCWFSFPCHPS